MLSGKSNHFPLVGYRKFCGVISSPVTDSREWMEAACPGLCPLLKQAYFGKGFFALFS